MSIVDKTSVLDRDFDDLENPAEKPSSLSNNLKRLIKKDMDRAVLLWERALAVLMFLYTKNQVLEMIGAEEGEIGNALYYIQSRRIYEMENVREIVPKFLKWTEQMLKNVRHKLARLSVLAGVTPYQVSIMWNRAHRHAENEKIARKNFKDKVLTTRAKAEQIRELLDQRDILIPLRRRKPKPEKVWKARTPTV